MLQRVSAGSGEDITALAGSLGSSDIDCPADGGGLGQRGVCLDSREELEHDLGTMLGMIRSGIDISMLDGFAPARLSDGSPLANPACSDAV